MKNTRRINTPYNRKRSKPEQPGTETQVETRGYRSTKQQVAEYMAAGLQLQNYRNEMYHFPTPEDVDEDFEDRTNDPGYDPADATQDLRAVNQRLKQQADAKKRQSLDDNKPKAEPDSDPPKEEE